jgi:hypothetical protein
MKWVDKKNWPPLYPYSNARRASSSLSPVHSSVFKKNGRGGIFVRCATWANAVRRGNTDADTRGSSECKAIRRGPTTMPDRDVTWRDVSERGVGAKACRETIRPRASSTVLDYLFPSSFLLLFIASPERVRRFSELSPPRAGIELQLTHICPRNCSHIASISSKREPLWHIHWSCTRYSGLEINLGPKAPLKPTCRLFQSKVI